MKLTHNRILIFLLLLCFAALLCASCTETTSITGRERLEEALSVQVTKERYTAQSYAAYKEAYDAAAALLNEENLTALAVDRAVDKLNAAKKALVAKNDFSELEKQVAFFLTVVESEYTKLSYQNYYQAYLHAKAVLDVDTSKQSEINSAATQMEEAKRGLQKIPDMSNLRALCERTIDESLYTGESVAAYNDAIRKGKALLEVECPTLEELRLTENMISEAYASLILRGNSSTLAAYVEEVRSKVLVADSSGRAAKDHFARSGYTRVTAALSQADKLLKQADASEADYENSRQTLKEAVESLVDISVLLDAYDRAGTYSATIEDKEYTEESYFRLSEAMAQCGAIMEKADVTSAEISAAVIMLSDVIDGMERMVINSDGLTDKELLGVRVKVGKSSILLADYFVDYAAFFQSIFSQNADFAFSANGDSFVFSRGKVRVTLAPQMLYIEYTGSSPVAKSDVEAASISGVTLDLSEWLIASEEHFGSPTDYAIESRAIGGRIHKIATLTYIDERDGLSMDISYDTDEKHIVSVTFNYTPAEDEEPNEQPPEE